MTEVTASKSTNQGGNGSRRISLGQGGFLTITGKVLADLESGNVELRIRENGEGHIAVDVLSRIEVVELELGHPSRFPLSYAAALNRAGTTGGDAHASQLSQSPAKEAQASMAGKSRKPGNTRRKKASRLSRPEIKEKVERDRLSAMRARLDRMGIAHTGDTSDELLASLSDPTRKVVSMKSHDFKAYALQARLPGYREASDRRAKQKALGSTEDKVGISYLSAAKAELPSGDAGKCVRRLQEDPHQQESETTLEAQVSPEKARAFPLQKSIEGRSKQVQKARIAKSPAPDPGSTPPGAELPPVEKEEDPSPTDPFTPVSRRPRKAGRGSFPSTSKGRRPQWD
jgi:hypothetical protein